MVHFLATGSYIYWMGLYEAIASSYDELFPLPPQAAPFLDALVAPRGGSRPRRLLDSGCATGSQALALAGLGWEAVGVDSEKAMIGLASARAEASGLAGRASFACLDMLKLEGLYQPGSFDLVLCLGNTLPHLRGGGAGAFLGQARRLLAPGGALVLQLLNFGLPDMGPGYSFPTISAGALEMRRRYEALSGEKGGAAAEPRPSPGLKDSTEALRFVVELESPEDLRREETLLEPIAPPALAALLLRAGFPRLERYSAWSGASFDEAVDRYLISVARPD